MAGIEIPAELKVEYLLHNVQQLSPTELDEFTQKFTEWQNQRETAIDEKIDNDASDDEVIAFIRKNSQLPEKENRRYWELRRMSDDETLSDEDRPEYRELVRRLTVMTATRLDALAILVQRWQKPVEDIMAELGLVISQEITIGEAVDPDASDAEVLASIRANLLLPEKENRRYWELRHKSDEETLSDTELPEYQELVRLLTILNTKRIEGIAVLVKRWGKSAEEIIREFGLKAGNDVSCLAVN